MKAGWKYALAALPFALGIGLHLYCGGGGSKTENAPPPTQVHYVSLAWKASTTSVIGYNIYRATYVTSCGTFKRLNSQMNTGTLYTDSTVIDGSSYCYAATTVNSSNSESGYSNIVSNLQIPTP